MRAEISELIAWFTKRYPTVKQRLRYARGKFREVTDRPWRGMVLVLVDYKSSSSFIEAEPLGGLAVGAIVAFLTIAASAAEAGRSNRDG